MLSELMPKMHLKRHEKDIYEHGQQQHNELPLCRIDFFFIFRWNFWGRYVCALRLKVNIFIYFLKCYMRRQEIMIFLWLFLFKKNCFFRTLKSNRYTLEPKKKKDMFSSILNKRLIRYGRQKKTERKREGEINLTHHNI